MSDSTYAQEQTELVAYLNMIIASDREAVALYVKRLGSTSGSAYTLERTLREGEQYVDRAINADWLQYIKEQIVDPTGRNLTPDVALSNLRLAQKKMNRRMYQGVHASDPIEKRGAVVLSEILLQDFAYEHLPYLIKQFEKFASEYELEKFQQDIGLIPAKNE